MEKGDILKFKNYKTRGLCNNCYFYCKGVIDDEPIFVRCIITQNGVLFLNSEIVDVSYYEKDLVSTTIEEFMNNKFNFDENTCIAFNHKKYDSGMIREINDEDKTLIVEVEDEDTSEYDEIKIKFGDVITVYPEFTYNDRYKFKQK